MPTFKEQIAAIAKIRQQRQECDDKLYQTRLQIQRAELQLKRANQQHTVPSIDQQKVNELRGRMARLQALLAELNRELAALDAVFSKVKESEQLVIFLQNKINYIYYILCSSASPLPLSTL